MPYSWDDIRLIVEKRRSLDGPLKRHMIEIRDRYNGDYVIPLPSVDGAPEMDPPVPKLVADGIDHTAMHAASMRPVIEVPAIDPAKETGVRSREYARIRRKAYYSVWHKSQLNLAIRRAYRHLTGYGELAFVVVPDFKNGIPRIELRDPLTAYPEPRTPEDVRNPGNAAFVFGRTADWILSNFPEAQQIISDYAGDASDVWDLVEWIDEEQIVIGIIGPRQARYWQANSANEGEFSMKLRSWPNRAGICTAVVTRRVTLDKIAGQLSNVLPTIDLMGQLMSLDVLAAEKAIFPDRFIVGQDGRPPQLLSGEWKDGRSGKTNVLSDVQQVGELQSSPGPLTHPVIDRLREAAQFSGGVLPQFGGLTSGSLRTGRGLNEMANMSISPRVAELQELMGMALTFTNETVAACFEGYWPNKEFRLFSGWTSDTGHVEFTPSTHFETRDNIVVYSFPGADVHGAGVTVAQMTGAGLMSRHTGMARHPWVEDPEGEDRRIIEERLEDAVLTGIQQGAMTGSTPLVDVARIKQLINQGKPPEEAIIQANREAQERQVTEAPEAQPGQVASPETAPGLQPGSPAGQPPPSPQIEQPNLSLSNFRELANALRAR